MSKILAQRKGKRAATVVILWHGQKLLAALAESKDVALGLAKGYKAESMLPKAACSLGREQGCCSRPSQRLQGRELEPPMKPKFLATWATLAARVSWPLEACGKGFLAARGVLDGQCVLAAHGRLQPCRGLQKSS
ncbi:hypothetical protein BHE74_00033412 [Ensete ventricosum]|nr:hypothetical protein BHE74_00033412 [Ensete ventricosum]